MQTQQNNLTPLLGIKQTNPDYQVENGTYCHDCENIHISQTGKINLKPAWQKIADGDFQYPYFSERHRLLIAVKDRKLVSNSFKDSKIETIFETISLKPLDYQGIQQITDFQKLKLFSQISEQDISEKPYYCDIPQGVLIALENGIYLYECCYHGSDVKPFTKHAPYEPFAFSDNTGSLNAGQYSVALSYIFGGGKETALSPIFPLTVSENGRITIEVPPDYQNNAEYIRLYMTEPNGGELRKVTDYPPVQRRIEISVNPTLGRIAEFRHKSPMISGKYLTVAHGRVYVVRDNRLIWSETMAYHLTDERHNWLSLPEEITFVVAVNGGLWIGQRTGVLFLSGVNPAEWQIRKTAALAPISDSATLADSGTLPSELTQGGACAVWLSSNGYNIGTAGGELITPQSAVLNSITGDTGNTVACGKRLYTAVQAA